MPRIPHPLPRIAVATLLFASLLAAAWAQGGRTANGVPPAPGQVVAERLAMLPAAPVALAPFGGGTAALLEDGRLVATGAAGADAAPASDTAASDVRTLRRGLDGETLLACDGRLLAIDGTGRITAAPSPAGGDPLVGPAVSLHAAPACLSDGTIVVLDAMGGSLLRLSEALGVLGRTSLALLPDAAPTLLPGDLLAVLIEPTLRYRHGVLGDEVEASGVAIVDPRAGAVLARWMATDGRVVEERRVVAYAAAGRFGVVATVSGAGDGGALVVLAAEGAEASAAAAADDGSSLLPVAVASGLGQEQGQRWRHVLGAVGDRLYTVAAPHLGGPLERWRLPPDGGVLNREAYDLSITSHREGRRDLALGRLLPAVGADPPGLDLLLLPSRDLVALHLVACEIDACRVVASADLGGRIAAAPIVDRGSDGDITAVAGLEDGALVRVRFPYDRILTNPE